MWDVSITNSEVDDIKDWILRSFGYPVISVELENTGTTTGTADQIIYATWEAIEEYSSYINNWSIENQMGNMLGLPSDTDFTMKFVTQDFDFANSFTKFYSTQAGVGGEIPFKKSAFTITQGVQEYVLPSGITLSELLWFATPEVAKYMVDPWNEANWFAGEFGWDYAGHHMYFMRPVWQTVMMTIGMEMRNRVRMAEYQYKLVRHSDTEDKVILYPIPSSQHDGSLCWYWYYENDDVNRYDEITSGSLVSDPGTVQFNAIPYSAFNSPSKHWIKQYIMAKCKIILGNIRSKFASLPIPDAEISMDGEILRTEGREEILKLKEDLKEWLEKIKYSSMLESEAQAAEQIQSLLSYNPMKIYLA